jgi:DNA-binding response OmpR family regulator
MPAPRRLLLLTEDAALAGLLSQQFALGSGYAADAAPPAEGAELLAAGRHDAALLDADAAPGPEAWLARLRERSPCPVVVLGGAAGVAPRVAKPVRMAELLARLNAVLAVFDASPEAALALGPYVFHPAARWLDLPEGRRIRLTEKEAAVLLHLRRAAPRPVPRAELLGDVWGYSDAVATHTLETHIYRLRRKLGPAAELLVTEEGGYRLGA